MDDFNFSINFDWSQAEASTNAFIANLEARAAAIMSAPGLSASDRNQQLGELRGSYLRGINTERQSIINSPFTNQYDQQIKNERLNVLRSLEQLTTNITATAATFAPMNNSSALAAAQRAGGVLLTPGSASIAAATGAQAAARRLDTLSGVNNEVEDRVSVSQRNAQVARRLATNEEYLTATTEAAVARRMEAAEIQTRLAADSQYSSALVQQKAAQANINAQVAQGLVGTDYATSTAQAAAAMKQVAAQEARALVGNTQYIEGTVALATARSLSAAEINRAKAGDDVYIAAQTEATLALRERAVAEKLAVQAVELGRAQQLIIPGQPVPPLTQREALAASQDPLVKSQQQRDRLAQARAYQGENGAVGLQAYADEVAQGTAAQRTLNQAIKTAEAQELAFGENAEALRASMAEESVARRQAKVLLEAETQRRAATSSVMLDGEIVALDQAEVTIKQRKSVTDADRAVMASRALLADEQQLQLIAENNVLQQRIQRDLQQRQAAIVGSNANSYSTEGTGWQRMQQNLAARRGQPVKDASQYQTMGQFFGSKLLTTAGFAISGAAFFGVYQGLRNAFEQAEKLQIQFSLLKEQLRQIGSADEFPSIRDNIMSVARETGIAAQELSFLALQLRGAFAEEIKVSGVEYLNQQLESAAKISKVTGLSLKEITDSLTGVSKTFNTEFSSVGDVAIGLEQRFGVLAKETIEFTADIGPAAKEAGLSLKDLAAIGAGAQQLSGRSGASLAEALGRVLTTIEGNSAQVVAIFDELGGKASDSIISAVAKNKTGEVLKEIIKYYDQLDRGQQARVIEALGGARQGQTLAAIFKNAQQINKEFNRNNDQDAGKLNQRWNQFAGTLGQQFSQLKQSALQFVGILLNAGVIQGLTSIANAFKTILQTVSAVLAPLGKVVDAINSIGPGGGIGAGSNFFGSLIGTMSLFSLFRYLKPPKGAESTRGSRALNSGGSSLLNFLTFGLVSRRATAAAPVYGPPPAPTPQGTPGSVLPPAVIAPAATAAGATLASTLVPIAGTFAVLFGTSLLNSFRNKWKAEDAKYRSEFAKRAALDPEKLLDESKDMPGTNFFAGILGAKGKKGAAESEAKKQLTRQWATILRQIIKERGNRRIEDITKGLDEEEKRVLVNKGPGFYTIKNNNTQYLTYEQQQQLKETKEGQAQLATYTAQGYRLLKQGEEKPKKQPDTVTRSPLNDKTIKEILKYAEDYLGEEGYLLTKAAVEKLRKRFPDLDINAILDKARKRINNKAIDRAADKGEVLDSLQSAKQNYESGAISGSEYRDYLLRGVTAAQRVLDERGKSTGSPPAALLKQLSDARKALSEYTSKSITDQVEFINKLKELSTGKVDYQAQIDSYVAIIQNENVTDVDTKIQSLDKIMDLLAQQAQQKIDEAGTEAAKAAAAAEGVKIPEAARVLIIQRQIQLALATSSMKSQDLSRLASLLAISTDELGKRAAQHIFANGGTLGQAIEYLIDAQIAAIRAVLAAGVQAGEFTAAILNGLETQLTTLEGEKEKIKNQTGLWDELMNPDTYKANYSAGSGSEDNSAEELRSAQEAYIKAQLNAYKAIFSRDPVKQAELDREIANVTEMFANEQLAAAKTEAEQLQAQAAILDAQAARIQAENALKDAMYDIFKAQRNVVLAIAQASGDMIKVAELQLQALKEDLFVAGVNGAGQAQMLELQAQIIGAEASLRDAKLQEQEDTIAFNLETEQISKQQAIAMYQNLLDSADLLGYTEQQKRDLILKIRDLRNDLSQDLQFNLPTELRLPTLYEARRLSQSGGSYQDNRTYEITLNSSGGLDGQAAVDQIVTEINAPSVYGSYTRRY